MKRKKFYRGIVLNTGFKCDAEGCDYVETAPYDFEYLDEYLSYLDSYLDKKCPKCGAPLLTEKDHVMSVFLMKVLHHPLFRAINKIGGALGQKGNVYKFGLDGNGNLNIEKK